MYAMQLVCDEAASAEATRQQIKYDLDVDPGAHSGLFGIPIPEFEFAVRFATHSLAISC